MTTKSRIIATGLSFALFLSCIFIPGSGILTSLADGETADQTGTLGLIGETTGSKKGLTFKDTFTENWEGGLDLDKWNVEKYKDDYVSDFQVIDDPLGGQNEDGSANKVLTFTRKSTWLVPNDEYWPTINALSGDMAEITFKLYLKDFNATVNLKETQLSHDSEPGMICAYTDPNNYDGWYFASEVSDGRHGVTGYRSSRLNSVVSSAGIQPWAVNNGYFTKDFDSSGWVDAKITFSGANYTFELRDKNGLSWARSIKRVTSGGKFAIGNRLFTDAPNTQQTNGVVYIDDINITFTRSLNDTNDVQKDVNVYYAGNVFLNPGDTVNIIGEQLGTTVKSAKIKKIDTAVSLNAADAKYVNETAYDYYTDSNVTWDEIPAVDGSLIDDWTIQQRSNLGLKMIIPSGDEDGQEMYADKGSYAVLLEAADPAGKDAVVIINNPYVSLLMGDDGDFATSNGWIKLGGNNLSVQNDLTKVNAIITKADGSNPILVEQSKIYVDTTENNGESNDYYMMVNLDNLAPGNYKIMVHNGFGGNYGWSMPKDFKVKAKSDNEEWSSKGWFDVTEYGAKGDSKTNDTAAIYRAIDAAVQNGGGTIYFPARESGGVSGYRITSPLILGENISVVGDGNGRSIIFYTGYLEPQDKKYIISFENNFEMRDIQVTCMTNAFEEIIHRSTVGDENGKVYIKNTKILNDFTGAVSGASSQVLMEGYSSAAASAYIIATLRERYQAFYTPGVSDKLFAITGSEVRISPRASNSTAHLHISADYLYFSDFDMNNNNGEWSINNAKIAGFFEGGSTKSLGSHMLYRNVCNIKSSTNNRELFLSDGGGVSTNNHIQPLIDGNYTDSILRIYLDDELETMTSEDDVQNHINAVKDYVNKAEYKGRVYRLLDTTVGASQVYVTQGQGAGQMRLMSNVVTIGKYVYFTVDTPFTVTPNRSSEVTLASNVNKTFVNNCTFEDGSMVGTYGLSSDVVFDKTKMRKANSGVTFTVAYTKGLMWYCTAIRTDSREIGMVHTNVVETNPSGLLTAGNMSTAYANLGLRFSDNFYDYGGRLQLAGLSTSRVVTNSDTIFENNTFIGEDPAISVDTSTATIGVWLRGNKQYTEEGNLKSEVSPYSLSLKSYLLNKNTQINGTLKVMCDVIDSSVSDRVRGDVNYDGKISIKDITLIRFLLIEKLTTETLDSTYGEGTSTVYADVNNDGVVDVRDIYAIRNYILTGDFGDVGSSVD